MFDFENLDSFKMLVERTYSLINEKCLPSNSYRQPKSLWGLLCIELYDVFSINKSSNIHNWWKRNRNNYQTIVLKKMSKKHNRVIEKTDREIIKDSSDNNELFIEFNNEETTKAKEYISSSGNNGRKFFLTGFTNLLNKKLFELGFKCVLGKNSNWFSASRLPYWRGRYICSLKDQCNIVYTACIYQKILSNFILKLTWAGTPSHDILLNHKIPIRITGNSRKKMALQLTADGIANTKNNLNCNEGNKFYKFKFEKK